MFYESTEDKKIICKGCEYNHNDWACRKYGKFMLVALISHCRKEKEKLETYKDEDIEWK
jgi:hypothetical protein